MFHFTAVEKLAVRSNLARRRNNLGAKLGWGLAGYLHRPSMCITRYTSVHNVCFSLTCDTIHKGGEHGDLNLASFPGSLFRILSCSFGEKAARQNPEQRAWE